MNKKEKLAFGIVAALAMTSGGIAYGQSVNNVSSDQVIYACVTGVNGNIVKVSNTRKTCPRGTTPIQWNAVGPRGEQGIPGSAVAKGDKGDQGPQGEQGLEGQQGANGKDGGKSIYLVGPGDLKYEIVGQLVDVNGDFWELNQLNYVSLRPVESPIGRYEEFFDEPNCEGNKFFASNTARIIGSQIIYSSILERLISESPANGDYAIGLRGYKLTFSQNQSKHQFQSVRVIAEDDEGRYSGLCHNSGTRQFNDLVNSQEAQVNYIYKADFAGIAPSLDAEPGWSVVID